MNISKTQFLTNLDIQEAILTGNKPNNVGKVSDLSQGRVSFDDILKQKVNDSKEVKFSKHAIQRLELRNINLSDDQMKRLASGTDKAGAKGIKDSLVIVDDYAFIVNVPNKTVVTAMDQTIDKDNIFTNIDGAVIA